MRMCSVKTRRGFLKYLGLVLPFSLLPDCHMFTDPLCVNPEKLGKNGTRVDDEFPDDGIPDAFQYRSIGMNEDFHLKYFRLQTRIQYSFDQKCYLFRGHAFPYSPFYKSKVFDCKIDYKRYQVDKFYKMKTLKRVEEAILQSYRSGPELLFYRRTA